MTTDRSGAVHIEVRGTHDPTLLADLRTAIEAVVPSIDALAGLHEVEMPATRWLVCEDFERDVAHHLQSPFTTQRLGGQVSAKTMWEADDAGRVIALNSGNLLNPTDPRNIADQIFLAGHEYTHVMQESVRRASGVMAGVPIPSQTVRQAWRSITRIVGDEYRADVIAARLLSQIASVGSGEAQRPANIADTWALHHLAACEAVIADLHPTLPDLVHQYRTGGVSLDEMLHHLGRYTEQTLTMLAHWQATCDVLEIDDRWNLGDIPDLPATGLYVQPAWGPIEALLCGQPILPTPAELREFEPQLLDVGEAAITQLWATVGVTVEDLADGGQWINVEAPTR